MTIYRCNNCHFETDNEDDLEGYADFWSRVAPGEEIPAGDCPKCGAFCYIVKPGIYEYLDLSTGHLPAADRNWLDDKKNLKDLDMMVSISSHNYGWILMVPSSDLIDDMAEEIQGGQKAGFSRDYEISSALIDILRYANKHCCMLVNLDADGEQIDELKYYEED